MSDAASIAAATGVPESLVMRSAQARATATGTSIEAVLGAWGGGEAITPTSAVAPTAPTPEPPLAEIPSSVIAPTETAASVPSPVTAAPAPVLVAARPDPDAAPLLVGRTDHPIMALAVMVIVFTVSALLAVGVPALDARNAAADQIPGTTPILSSQALAGRTVYLQEGCMYCHTQQVRSVVTDVGLGPVSEPGTSPAVGPPTLGFVRIGPDLTHVETRYEDDEAKLRTVLVDPKSLNPNSLMPSFAHLSPDDLSALLTYLKESE